MLNADPKRPRHVVVLAHPDLSSFNASLAETYCRTVQDCSQDAVLRDLYALHFNPVLHQDERPGRDALCFSSDVRRELDAISGADVFVLVYPIWFGSPPAMLKGYIERVLGAGVTARAVQNREWNDLLGDRRLVSISTSATQETWLAEQGQDVSIRTLFDDYIQHAFAMKSAEHVHFGGITPNLSGSYVDQILHDVKERARQICAAVAAERNQRAVEV